MHASLDESVLPPTVRSKRIEALKTESRVFNESVSGSRGVHMLGEKPMARSSFSKEWRRGKGLSEKIEEDFDPFVDVEYDCKLKDCQDCGKV